MKAAFLFPGQGSQKVGMGQDLYENSLIARDIFRKTDEITGRNISKIIFNGPEEELNQTINTQVAIVAVSIALVLTFEEKLNSKKIAFKPAVCCGHSLGEFTALWYSKVINLETIIKLVAYRGQLMQNAKEGGMVAVFNLKINEIEELIKKLNLNEKVVIANYNSANQFVISGYKQAIELISHSVNDSGGKVVILPVSGAFHSPLMQASSNNFNEALDKLSEISTPKIPIYQNYDAKSSAFPKDILVKLKNQMTSPVLWTQTIKNLVRDSVTLFIEVGPGKVLTGLVKKTDTNTECENIFDVKSINNFIEKYEYKLLSTKSS